MRTEELIAHLAGDAEPVRPLPPPAIRVLVWSAVALGSTAAGIAAFGLKPDFAVVLRQPEFIGTAVLAFGTATFAAAASLVLAVPGAERSAALRGSSVLLAGLWLITLVAAAVRAGDGLSAVSDWPICFIRAVGIGLLPAVVLFVMLRRAAPLRLRWTGALAMTAAMSIGAVAVQIICPHNEPAHALLGHFGPVFALGWLSAGMGHRLLERAGR